MPTKDEIERAAKIGYEAAIANQIVREEDRPEHSWERQAECLREDWRETAGYMLAEIVADRDRLLAALKFYMSQVGQGYEAYGLPFGPSQREADESARAAIAGR